MVLNLNGHALEGDMFDPPSVNPKKKAKELAKAQKIIQKTGLEFNNIQPLTANQKLIFESYRQR